MTTDIVWEEANEEHGSGIITTGTSLLRAYHDAYQAVADNPTANSFGTRLATTRHGDILVSRTEDLSYLIEHDDSIKPLPLKQHKNQLFPDTLRGYHGSPDTKNTLFKGRIKYENNNLVVDPVDHELDHIQATYTKSTISQAYAGNRFLNRHDPNRL